MANKLNGKVAAVTGAASGIGLACARAMLAAGAEVVLIDRAEDRLRRALRRARTEGASAGRRPDGRRRGLGDAAAHPRARRAGSTSSTPTPAPISAAT